MADADLRVQSYARRATAGDEAEDYQGLPIFAFPGLHAFATAMAGAELAPGGRVLDVAAGSGALGAGSPIKASMWSAATASRKPLSPARDASLRRRQPKRGLR